MTDDDTDDRDIERRTYLKGVAVAGGAIGLGGAATIPASGQENGTGDSTVAEYCGTFSPGPQSQQCLSCVEARCPGEEVHPVSLVTGLSGQCFEPASIPADADYVALKAGQNCYVSSVGDNTSFCLPPGSPDVSNATFYRCGGEPEPAVVDFDVTCDEITVTTENVSDGHDLTATVTVLDADGAESAETFVAAVQDDAATFDLPGDLTPTNLVVTLHDTTLVDQAVAAEDAPCFEEPPTPPVPDDPRVDGLEVTCEGITVSTDDLEGETLSVTVSFVGDITETYDVTVDDDGTAVVPLPGEFDPSSVVVAFDDETLFDAAVQAVDAPCAEVPPEPPEEPEVPEEPEEPEEPEPPEEPEEPEPPEEPELPEPPENEKQLKKLAAKYERKYKECKRKYEKYEKQLEKAE